MDASDRLGVRRRVAATLDELRPRSTSSMAREGIDHVLRELRDLPLETTNSTWLTDCATALARWRGLEELDLNVTEMRALAYAESLCRLHAIEIDWRE